MDEFSSRHLRRLKTKRSSDLLNSLLTLQKKEEEGIDLPEFLADENVDARDFPDDICLFETEEFFFKESLECFTSTSYCFFDDSDDESSQETLDEENVKDDEYLSDLDLLKINLKTIIVKHSVSRALTEDILKSLIDYGIELPRTKNSILNFNKKSKPLIKDLSPGQYLHIGIENNLKNFNYDCLLKINEILIDVGIDGLPLYKSSKASIWPILGFIVGQKNIPGFIIGVYLGPSHPSSADDFLKDFVDEVQSLRLNGVLVSEKNVRKSFNVRLFNCDTPAKSFIRTTKHHNALHGCHSCDQIGSWFQHRTVFMTKSGNLRTDEDILNRVDMDHHNKNYTHKLNVLELNDFKIDQFPLDVMHLVYLGATKKILRLLSDCNKKMFIDLSEEYIKFRPFIPKEFCRKPRGFDELPRWKATELRLFCLYTGMILLKNVMEENAYEHFLDLCCAIRLLSHPNDFQARSNADTADILLDAFVENFGNFYGIEQISYNIHNMLHLADCVRKHGSLENFSCFKSENFMQELKKKVKKPTQILQQIHNRVHEQWSISREGRESTIPLKTQKEFSNGSFHMSTNFKNSVCLVEDVPFSVKEFRFNESEQFMVGHRFDNPRDFFSKPASSIQLLGIMEVGKVLEQEEYFPVSQIQHKFMILPYDENYVLIPILHFLQ